MQLGEHVGTEIWEDPVLAPCLRTDQRRLRTDLIVAVKSQLPLKGGPLR